MYRDLCSCRLTGDIAEEVCVRFSEIQETWALRLMVTWALGPGNILMFWRLM